MTRKVSRKRSRSTKGRAWSCSRSRLAAPPGWSNRAKREPTSPAARACSRCPTRSAARRGASTRGEREPHSHLGPFAFLDDAQVGGEAGDDRQAEAKAIGGAFPESLAAVAHPHLEPVSFARGAEVGHRIGAADCRVLDGVGERRGDGQS